MTSCILQQRLALVFLIFTDFIGKMNDLFSQNQLRFNYFWFDIYSRYAQIVFKLELSLT